ncbi:MULTISPECIES: hypothetical protein [Vibrio]|jgi:hypothetical protein|uniref:Uncharacterized protein n=1 Tax=Vibrio fortis TaxID=212667 RepID=A0A066UPD7_9VIBR|nr:MULTISPECIES: hypothetical protein [Vibrio]EJG1733783.1 hypothetical protein [Vibrio parahaemolyticus]EJG2229458.1 hypothetical protein [Vibrio parahaemolyticus]ELB2062178.1 hypothetical protein [Vibrio parahaemolyticus]KAB0292017.1 hypothetical protein F2P58_02480 [Vibrio fortis]KAB2112195.1 hypothetical protein F6475_19245 [Vibrio alginolyticus]|tara:strand:+ start:300 stop:530 length:231 start_codon:yes stop_codon:yes gene_type:complete
MSFLTGIIGKTLLEVLKGLFFQIGWKIILERFATRLVVWGLETLKGLSTNDVLQETVDDIIAALQGKRLKEIPQKE